MCEQIASADGQTVESVFMQIYEIVGMKELYIVGKPSDAEPYGDGNSQITVTVSLSLYLEELFEKAKVGGIDVLIAERDRLIAEKKMPEPSSNS